MNPLSAARRALDAYRRSGADLPFGAPVDDHGTAMEGYYWRFTDAASGRSVIALIGVQRPESRGAWALVGVGAEPGRRWTHAILRHAAARPRGPGAWASGAEGTFHGDDRHVRAELPGVRLDVTLDELRPYPPGPFGGSSVFQCVPALNQYWHPWLLGGRASGVVEAAGERWRLDGAEVYAEKNWGAGGFPDAWWWGQAQGFGQDACVAFAGGRIHTGPPRLGLRTEVTAVVVRLPGGRVVRWGNPGTSPVKAAVGADEEERHGSWTLRGRAPASGWAVEIDADAPVADALILPVPLVEHRTAVDGDLENLAGRLTARVTRRGRLVWEGESTLAALERGGLGLAASERRRRRGGGVST